MTITDIKDLKNINIFLSFLPVINFIVHRYLTVGRNYEITRKIYGK